MQKSNVPYLLLFAAIVGCTKGLPPVDGTWTVTAATLGAMSIPADAFKDGPLKLVSGSYEFQGDTGTYTVMADSTPAAIDVHGVSGPNAGKTFPAIYKFDGDTLVICYDLSGSARPKEFKSDSGTKTFLAKYTRKAP